MAMNMQFDDDFENIPTTSKTSAPSNASPAAAAATAQAKAPVEEEESSKVLDNESLDTDFDDEKVYALAGATRPDSPR